MTKPYDRLNEAIRAEIAKPIHDSLADAAMDFVLAEAYELARTNPDYEKAFQALTEHFGYV